MAQAGMYVPARHARIGMVDRIFSRLGSADDLAADKSTFLVFFFALIFLD
jgi:DNA mismatch repair protein MutS